MSPDRRNSDTTRITRLFIKYIILEIDDSNFVFVDEVLIYIYSWVKKERSLIGTLPVVTVSDIIYKSKNISVIVALNKNEVIHHKINNGPVKF